MFLKITSIHNRLTCRKVNAYKNKGRKNIFIPKDLKKKEEASPTISNDNVFIDGKLRLHRKKKNKSINHMNAVDYCQMNTKDVVGEHD